MTARVHAFPLRRDRHLVARLSREMSRIGPDAVEHFLLDRLGMEWDRLEDIGVECSEIEAEIYEFAGELWARAFPNINNSPGAA
ncbi:hypothetical protein IQ16_01769 [Bradyrhizobium huanghuaihaiense]|uniref:Uncharacterized protein n=1 Tax=Bradyrhizobium huanghuaihaiense TaxID=990078 RepID=A0A562RX12_9BRAD|nr:DUF6074 family protein [Bradyrhizobium huanghuaihaiense]TWI73631.1 hypothetical protein IQ16_01769 [Bradyrhizobium huanghuaihaiense]